MRVASGIKGRGKLWIAAAILAAIATGFLLTPGARDPFAFEPHIVPRWKYW